MDHCLTKRFAFEHKDNLAKLWQEAPLSSDVWAKKNPNMPPYALGWYTVNRPLNKKIVTAGGGQSAIAVYPDDDITIVVLTNLTGAKPENLMDELAEFYVDDFRLPDNVKLLKQSLNKTAYKDSFVVANTLSSTQNIKFNAGELNHFAGLLAKYNKLEQSKVIYNLNNQLFSKVLLDTKTLDKYAGEYELANFSIMVSRNSNALSITATGDATLPVFSVTNSQFILKRVDASVSFIKDENAKVNGLTLKLKDQDLQGNKIN